MLFAFTDFYHVKHRFDSYISQTRVPVLSFCALYVAERAHTQKYIEVNTWFYQWGKKTSTN